MKVFGITGWKNTGKTGLTERLVAHFSASMRVATLKHAHHGFDIDRAGTDSFRHRAAGAGQVLIASSRRVALMTELGDAPEPSVEALLAQLAPADLVLIEGWKSAAHPKIETWLETASEPPRAGQDPTIKALACRGAIGAPCPVLDIDDTIAIADFIRAELGL